MPAVSRVRTPESHLKGVFQHSIFAIRTFFQNPIRIPEDTSKFSVPIQAMTYTSKKKLLLRILLVTRCIEVESEVSIYPPAQAALLHPF